MSVEGWCLETQLAMAFQDFPATFRAARRDESTNSPPASTRPSRIVGIPQFGRWEDGSLAARRIRIDHRCGQVQIWRLKDGITSDLGAERAGRTVAPLFTLLHARAAKTGHELMGLGYSRLLGYWCRPRFGRNAVHPRAMKASTARTSVPGSGTATFATNPYVSMFCKF